MSAEYDNITMFSINIISDNSDLYENKKIYDTNHNQCDINKRMKKIIDLYYKMFC
jgi:hypothetical protein